MAGTAKEDPFCNGLCLDATLAFPAAPHGGRERVPWREARSEPRVFCLGRIGTWMGGRVGSGIFLC